MNITATATTRNRRLYRLLTATVFYTIFGFQLAKLSQYFIPTSQQNSLLALLALWFGGLSWLSNQPCRTYHRGLLHLVQGISLSSAQFLIIYHNNDLASMSSAAALSFIGINCGLITPWLSHSQAKQEPLTYIFGTLTPLIGIIIGHTLAVQAHTPAPVALIIWPIVMSIVQFRRLKAIEPTYTELPKKHLFYWLNIGWFWLSVTGYLLSNTMNDPIFLGICFLLGFAIALSFSQWDDTQTWQTNSSAIWLIIQGYSFIAHTPMQQGQNLINAAHIIFFGAVTCKLLIPAMP